MKTDSIATKETKRALRERKPSPTLCHFFRCVRQTAAPPKLITSKLG